MNAFKPVPGLIKAHAGYWQRTRIWILSWRHFHIVTGPRPDEPPGIFPHHLPPQTVLSSTDEARHPCWTVGHLLTTLSHKISDVIGKEEIDPTKLVLQLGGHIASISCSIRGGSWLLSWNMYEPKPENHPTTSEYSNCQPPKVERASFLLFWSTMEQVRINLFPFRGRLA